MKNPEHPLDWFIFIIKSPQVIQLASVGCLGLVMHALNRMQEMMLYRKQPPGLMCTCNTGGEPQGFPGGSLAGSSDPGCFLLQLCRSRNPHRKSQPTAWETSRQQWCFWNFQTSTQVCWPCFYSVIKIRWEDLVDSILKLQNIAYVWIITIIVIMYWGGGIKSRRSTAIVFSGSLLVLCNRGAITLFLEIIATIFEYFLCARHMVNALHTLSHLFFITTPWSRYCFFLF